MVGLGAALQHRITFRFGRARDVTNRARIVQQQFQDLPPRHLLQAYFRVRPIQRAFDAAEIQPRGWADALIDHLVLPPGGT